LTTLREQMRILFLIFTAIFFLSCGRPNEVKTPSVTTSDQIENGRPGEVNAPPEASPDKTENIYDFNVALKFINGYAIFCTPRPNRTVDTNWVRNNSLLTENFKAIYYNLMDSVNKKDPEYGLGFDPIFDAQDFPDKGFEIINSDSIKGFVTLKGKDWPEFVLVLKVVNLNGKSLVDGCGIINIPADKRRKR